MKEIAETSMDKWTNSCSISKFKAAKKKKNKTLCNTWRITVQQMLTVGRDAAEKNLDNFRISSLAASTNMNINSIKRLSGSLYLIIPRMFNTI